MTFPEQWDLSKIYMTINDLDDDFARLEDLVENFKSCPITHLNISSMITEYEKVIFIMSKLSAYADLKFSEDQISNGKIFQNIHEKLAVITGKLSWFLVGITKLDASCLAAVSNIGHRAYIENAIRYKDHVLQEELEEKLAQKRPTTSMAWIKLYDQQIASINIDNCSLAEMLHKTLSPNRNERKDTFYKIASALEQKGSIVTFVMNTIAKDKLIEDDWRKYKNPASQMNLSNKIDDDQLDTLVQAIKDLLPEIAQKFYRWKQKFLNIDQLEVWDRLAPLEQDAHTYSFEECVEITLSSLRKFSPKLAEIAHKLSNNVNATNHPHKSNSQFCRYIAPSIGPYISVNFRGSISDVITFAHELGHGIHGLLAEENGIFALDMPLTLCETASIFTQNLLLQDDNPVLLAKVIDDMLGTIQRQIAFYCFEKELFQKRAIQELSQEEIEEIWINTQKEVLCPAFNIVPEYKNIWIYISHFFHAPFYVYSYAFSGCFVNSLLQLYKNNYPDFEEKYINMLKVSAFITPKQAAKEFGFDLNYDFWKGGIDYLGSLVDKLCKDR